MNVSIKYCVEWNYLPRAAGLAAELKNQFGADIDLIKGGGGVFDVKVDGNMVFSKHQVGRFPNDGEVEDLVRRISGS